jgi:hypothetical protein
MPALIAALLLAVTVATANTAAFEMRAMSLRQQWAADQAAGVPGASLDPARRDLAADQARRAGLVPYAAVSGAAFADPFEAQEASAGAASRSATAAARRRAAAALDRLRAAAGPNDRGAARAVQLASAASPVAADALARRWDAQAGALEAVRRQLGIESGGLTGGLPADVVEANGALSDMAARADGSGMGAGRAGDAIADADLYLARPYPALLAGHRAIVDELRSASAWLQGRLDLGARADAMVARDAGMLQSVTGFGAGPDFASRFDAARSSLAAARAARDDAALDAAVAGLARLDGELAAATGGRLPTGGIPCQPGAPAQLIVIHLATQQLVAYQDGCPILRTPVTTGRSALPTGRGTFHIYYKAARYHMISPWPMGNAFYYPPTWVSNAMEFIGNGTFIHSADWQPADTYGPDSEYGPYGSHGCVHVLDDPLQQLYDWAAIGATVVVED